MRSLRTLTIANVKSFLRDRAALFWTILFPVIFIVLFGLIFSGGGGSYTLGWADEDHTPASTALHATIDTNGRLKLADGDRAASLEAMKQGKLDAVVVVPKGYGDALKTGGSAISVQPVQGAPGSPKVSLTLYVDPSSQNTAGTITQAVGQAIAIVNQSLSGRPPVIGLDQQQIQTGALSAAAFFVPSILAMALMQLGIFSAIPIVEQRQKGILKRLSATPLPRWTLVGSNIGLRLIIATLQTVIILAVGALFFGVRVAGNPLVIAGFIVLGALAFTSIGYVVASFAPTEESANFIVSAVQFPMMFLSGIFFSLQALPEWLRQVATLLPLTYLGDALRQTMVGGVPFAPLAIDAVVLGGWLIVCLMVSARYFRWT